MTQKDPLPTPQEALSLAMRYTYVTLSLLAVAGLIKLVKFQNVVTEAAWWIWGVVAVSVVIACLIFAALATRIGVRRANNVLVLALALLLCAGVFVFTRYLDHR